MRPETAGICETIQNTSLHAHFFTGNDHVLIMNDRGSGLRYQLDSEFFVLV